MEKKFATGNGSLGGGVGPEKRFYSEPRGKQRTEKKKNRPKKKGIFPEKRKEKKTKRG